MKTKLRSLILVFSIASILTYAQNPVPNPGFENWTAGEPDDWYTNNSGAGGNPVTKTTDSFLGSAAAQGTAIQSGAAVIPPMLSSTDANYNGFPVSQTYDYLNFYYKFDRKGNDVFTITVAMIDASGANFVASALTDISDSANTYTPFSIALGTYTGTPVTCIIAFKATDATGASATAGTSFKVDKISLSNTAVTGITQNAANNIFQLSQNNPNPAKDITRIAYQLTKQSDVQIAISDLTGKVLYTFNPGIKPAGNYIEEVNVKDLENGIYLYNFSVDGMKMSKKLMVMH